MERELRRNVYDNLVRGNAHGLYALAFALAGDVDAAERLVRATYAEAWRRIGSLRDVTAERAWLAKILRSLWAREQEVRSDDETSLGDEDREALLFALLGMLSFRDTADVLGVAPDALLSRARRAHESLGRGPFAGGREALRDPGEAGWRSLLAESEGRRRELARVDAPRGMRQRLLEIPAARGASSAT